MPILFNTTVTLAKACIKVSNIKSEMANWQQHILVLPDQCLSLYAIDENTEILILGIRDKLSIDFRIN